MPIYEYRCRDCDTVFEIIQIRATHTAARGVACPACQSRHTERCWSRVTVETDSKSYHPARPVDV
jgi:putative FmdB family regulatory protein